MNAGRMGRLGAIDPRVKLGWVGALLVAGLIFTEPVTLGALLASIVLVAALGGVLVGVARGLRGLTTVIVVIGLLFGVLVPGQPLLTLPFGLLVSWEGLRLGLVSALRMLIFAAPLVIVVGTTTNSDLLRALLWLRLPPEFALMIVLALNFVPLYLDELGRITEAQKARAYALAESGPLDRLRGVVPLFLPLTLNAVDRADTVGKVLEMRGFARRQLRPEFAAVAPGSYLLLAWALVVLAFGLASLLAQRDLMAEWLPIGRSV